ncbi:MAG: acetate kinase, partial [Candidatus Micrarchaeia archaeon]
FTGGIGENSWLLRNLVCEKLKKIGIELNEEKNKNNELLISTSKSKINVFVIKTEEEEEMVRITAQQ